MGKTIHAEGWSIEGAIEVLASVPYPGTDAVSAPDYTTIESARTFLSRFDKDEVASFMRTHREQLNSSTHTPSPALSE